MKIAVLNLPADQFILVLSECDAPTAMALSNADAQIREMTGAKATFVSPDQVDVVEMHATERLEQVKAAIRDFIEREQENPEAPDLSALEAAVAEPTEGWTQEELSRLRDLLGSDWKPLSVRDAGPPISPEDVELGVVPKRTKCLASWDAGQEFDHACVLAPGHGDNEHACRCGEKAPRGSSKVTQYGR